MVLDYRNMVFKGYSTIWKTQLFSDVDVKVLNRVFRAHKVILSAHSPFFLSMFTCPMRECTMQTVVLKTIDPKIFQLILQCMYTGEIAIDEENCRDILYAADLLLMRELVDACCEFIFQRIDVHNCIDVMRVADAHSCDDLKQAALTFICQNIPQLSSTESFLNLTFTEAAELLDRKDLPCLSEVNVLKAAFLWLVHDIRDRKCKAFQLLSCVRFESITVRDFNNTIASLPTVHDKAFSVVIASLRSDLLTGKLFRNHKFCKPKRGCKFVLLFGGVGVDAFNVCCGSTDVYRYDVTNDQWLKLESFNFGRYNHAISIIGNRVYLIGGNDECFSDTSSVECYNVTTGVWSHKCRMMECRKNPQVITVNGRMYVSSAEVNEECMSKIEVYDHRHDTWSAFYSALEWLPTECSCTTVYQDQLYELVNSDKSATLRVTPLYLESDPENRYDIGVYGEPMYPHPHLSYKRYKCAIVPLGGYLYLIGGCEIPSDYDYTSNMHCTVDRLNLAQNKWESVCPMNYPRAGHTAQAVNNRIYVFGGQQDALASSFLEVYSADIDMWECRKQPANFLFSASVIY